MTIDIIILGMLSFFLISTLYSSVGHGGASGYLAVMALLSFPPAEIKPVALILNIVVASIGSYRYIKAGYFDKKVFSVFAVFSLPLAFLGGFISIDDTLFTWVAGVFLIVSALLIIQKTLQKEQKEYTVQPVAMWKAGLTGGSIGFISGLIGIGGGIFLSPLLLLFRWATPKHISGISALFIVVNSVLGLSGHMSSIQSVPENTFYWLFAVILGGITGSYLGSKKMNTKGIFIVLTIVLMTAGVKMLFF
jgi:uncharacterized membrane protein YfcA